MFNRIVVDYDLTHLRPKALLALLDMAQQNHATLTFLVLRPKLDELLSKSEAEFILSTRRSIELEWASLLAEAHSRALEPTLEILTGDPVATLLEFSQAHNADLIVMGKHHTGGLSGAVMGVPWKQLVSQTQMAVMILP